MGLRMVRISSHVVIVNILSLDPSTFRSRMKGRERRDSPNDIVVVPIYWIPLDGKDVREKKSQKESVRAK